MLWYPKRRFDPTPVCLPPSVTWWCCGCCPSTIVGAWSEVNECGAAAVGDMVGSGFECVITCWSWLLAQSWFIVHWSSLLSPTVDCPCLLLSRGSHPLSFRMTSSPGLFSHIIGACDLSVNKSVDWWLGLSIGLSSAVGCESLVVGHVQHCWGVEKWRWEVR